MKMHGVEGRGGEKRGKYELRLGDSYTVDRESICGGIDSGGTVFPSCTAPYFSQIP